MAMGMLETFESDTLRYRGWQLLDNNGYNSFLIAGSRVFGEELAAVSDVSYLRGGGTLWAGVGDGVINTSVIHILAFLLTIERPFELTKWRQDGEGGESVESDGYSVPGTGGGAGYGTQQLTKFSAEPKVGNSADGYSVWAFGSNIQSLYGGPTYVRPESYIPDSLVYIVPADYSLADMNEDFAQDSTNYRLWARSSSDTPGVVHMYENLGSISLVADLYSANPTRGIFPDTDGYVHIFDDYGFLHTYDYAGSYWGSSRQPLDISALGYMVGWDNVFKRLLIAQVTASAVNGQSTITVKGYKPEPDPSYLTIGIPKHVPRKNRKTYYFAHVTGEGAEPIAGQVAKAGTKLISNTDADGDLLGDTTPASAGSIAINLTTDPV
jgi:hypothetical protein